MSVREGMCLHSCQMAKRGRGNGSGLLQRGASTSNGFTLEKSSRVLYCPRGETFCEWNSVACQHRTESTYNICLYNDKK